MSFQHDNDIPTSLLVERQSVTTPQARRSKSRMPVVLCSNVRTRGHFYFLKTSASIVLTKPFFPVTVTRDPSTTRDPNVAIANVKTSRTQRGSLLPAAYPTEPTFRCRSATWGLSTGNTPLPRNEAVSPLPSPRAIFALDMAENVNIKVRLGGIVVLLLSETAPRQWRSQNSTNTMHVDYTHTSSLAALD